MNRESCPREYLLSVEADDGLVVPGVSIDPPAESDACLLWINGFGVSYDYPPYLQVMRAVAAAGTSTISAAVRGHHGGVTGWVRQGERWRTTRIGSWYERFGDSALDIAAWLRAARSRGHSKVILAGHSFGAAKALYALAVDRLPVDGLVLASPGLGLTRLDMHVVRQAHSQAEQGRSAELLPDGSLPHGFGTTTVSAQTYLSWAEAAAVLFGPSPTWKQEIECPVFAYYGDTRDIGGNAELDLFTGGMTNSRQVTTTILSGVGHNIDQAAGVVADALNSWLRKSGILEQPSVTGGTL